MKNNNVSFDKKIKIIMKDKSINSNQKFEKIAEIYREYFAKKFTNDVKMQTYEIHFEFFTIYNSFQKKYIKSEYKYRICFQYEFENLLYCRSVELIRNIETLEKNGFDANTLNKYDMILYSRIKTLQKSCGFNYDFPYDAFYSKDKIRKFIINNLTKFYKCTINDWFCKNETDCVNNIK